jgi:hypothetical protein
MLPLLLMANNKHVADKVLAAAGYLGGLGQMDVRELSQTRIPVWAVAAAGAVVGLVGGVWVMRKLPASWVLGKKHRTR